MPRGHPAVSSQPAMVPGIFLTDCQIHDAEPLDLALPQSCDGSHCSPLGVGRRGLRKKSSC